LPVLLTWHCDRKLPDLPITYLDIGLYFKYETSNIPPKLTHIIWRSDQVLPLLPSSIQNIKVPCEYSHIDDVIMIYEKDKMFTI
jgi:hypothetical protein